MSKNIFKYINFVLPVPPARILPDARCSVFGLTVTTLAPDVLAMEPAITLLPCGPTLMTFPAKLPATIEKKLF